MNFDFHNLLFPEEFESLCRDILEIREKPITFTTYRRGKDGGIDINSTNTSIKIIGQCKLYNPNNYSSLKTALKKEVKKCEKQNPDRYILCINYNLNINEAKEILKLFKGYIHKEEDIIDGIKLNKYLGLAEYQFLKKTYSKLLVPNLNFVETTLENIVKKKFYNKTKSFFNIIAKEHKLYHNTKILRTCIDRLEENKVLILTGNPGVGKTTTAKMIANYFLHQRISVLFLENRDFVEVEGLYDDNQLIVVDDFWGQNFSPDLKKGSILRSFNRIVEGYKNDSNRYLLLTSREYIIRDVWNNSEFETKDILENEKYLIDLNEYSEEDKVRIFLNHLLFFDFKKEYFSYLKYDDILENIIHHRNYSPRHVEYFIKQYLKNEEASKYTLFKGFYRYLDSPQEYWNNNFHKLNDTSQLILFVILISSDPIDKTDLESTFEVVQEEVRRILYKSIQPTNFENELNLLEGFYITSDKNEYLNQILIRFQNPGIKDYLLEYLRTKGKSWIKPLIENVPYFNQLYFVFSTKEEDIEDYESENSLYGKKIILSDKYQLILKQRLLSEFHQLSFCNLEAKAFTDQYTKYQNSEETKYWKLTLLNWLFNIYKKENKDVRGFIIDEVIKDIQNYNSEKSKIVDPRSMIYFPNIIELIKPFIELDNQKILFIFHSSITFTKEYDFFYAFKEVFPLEFEAYLKEHIKAIRKSIYYHIIDDIDYYLWFQMDVEFDMHLDHYIEEVCKKYGIRITKKFVKKIESIAGCSFQRFSITEKEKRLPNEKFKPKKFEKIIDSYLSYDLDDFNAIAYLKNINKDKALIKNIEKDLRSNKSILKPFTGNQIIFSTMIEFLSHGKQNLSSYNCYSILDLFLTYYSAQINIKKKTLNKFFFDLEEDNLEYDYSITGTQIKKLIREKKLSIGNTNILAPIIIPDKSWFKFSTPDFQVYFIIQHLINIKDDKVFKEEVIAYSDKVDDSNLLKVLDLVCHSRLTNIVVAPELERCLCQIDTTTEKSTVLSLIKFFQIGFELEWYKSEKTFEVNSSSNTECFLELILQYLGIDFSTEDFENFFIEDYYHENNSENSFMDFKGYNKLYKQVITTLTPEKKAYAFNTQEATCYKIHLLDFATNTSNYELLKDVGFEKHFFNLFDEIKHELKRTQMPDKT